VVPEPPVVVPEPEVPLLTPAPVVETPPVDPEVVDAPVLEPLVLGPPVPPKPVLVKFTVPVLELAPPMVLLPAVATEPVVEPLLLHAARIQTAPHPTTQASSLIGRKSYSNSERLDKAVWGTRLVDRPPGYPRPHDPLSSRYLQGDQ
jgi:hypothetical protein